MTSHREQRNVGEATIELIVGDITEQSVDAIVNAANSRLGGGGGVDGAIHRGGGPSILEECRRLGGCATGDAKPTRAGNLSARWVIHAVGPVYRDGQSGEAGLLASAYRRSIDVARRLGARSMAFPSLSTGAYRYPLADAARIAVETVAAELARDSAELRSVRFVLFDTTAYDAFRRALADL
jgi:O-acetyl-ADP-ribose deacetylase (regulator of RNase III)